MKKTSSKTSKKPTEKSKSSPDRSSETTKAQRPFDVWAFVNALSYNKKYLFNEDTQKIYDPWTINKAFSLYVDTVYLANDMNQYYKLPKKLQHDYLINSIRSRSRYEKWVKVDKDSEEAKTLAAIQEYYRCSRAKAQAALSILTEEQIAIIKTRIDKGGIAK